MFSKSTRFKTALVLAALGSLVAFQNCSKSLDSNSQAAPPSSSSSVERMTVDLVEKSQSGAISSAELNVLAEERQKALLDLAQSKPSEVLRVSIPEEKQSQLPSRLSSLLEKRVELEGELVILHIDHLEKEQSRYEYEVHGKSGEVHTLHISKLPTKELMTGTKVRIKGVELVEELPSGKKKKHLVSEDAEDSILILAAENSTSYGTVPGARFSDSLSAFALN